MNTATNRGRVQNASVSKRSRPRHVSNQVKTFAEKVRDVVRTIPKGETMTYKEVATKAGNARAARAVGAVMRGNYALDIPCHRVIKSNGSLGSYNRGGTKKKRSILKKEGALE